MSYTKRNLNEIKDSAVEYGFSEHQEARFPRTELGALATGLAYLKVKAGKREAFAHRHAQAEEILVVLAGSGRVKLDAELVDLAPLDAVRISPGVTRGLEAGDDGLEVIVFGAHVAGDGEMIQDFWDS